jgi:hypothetical protein
MFPPKRLVFGNVPYQCSGRAAIPDVTKTGVPFVISLTPSFYYKRRQLYAGMA